MPTEIPGFNCAFHFCPGHAPRALVENEVAGELVSDEGWLWLHLNLADNRCSKWLAAHAGIAMGSALELVEPPARQSISDATGVIVGHLSAFRHDFDGDTRDHAWLHFMLLERTVITGRNRAIQSAEQIRQLLSRGATFGSPPEFLTELVAKFADRLEIILHELTDDIALIEDHVLDDRHRGERRRLMLLRREAATHHRHARAMRRALLHAERTVASLPAGFAMLSIRLLHIDQDLEVLESRARFFHDEIDAKLAAETNRQLFVLSALTAVFLPPALVAGLFGMNFQAIPFADSERGFYYAMLVCVLSSAAVVLFMWASNRHR